ncbi:sigma-70 family RNA polymerase sigma factor [Schleiferiaceae bacterium]|nr:RNA polymerase subunit sigma-24 [Flavobacteriales bacterium]MDC1022334.1 sigma-70 family RNA polymerase sigma factor [Schleiferiaceae bacterium]|tara:strand:+ start:3008 stop:3592 length:585 start_codon:yes stop_codon:yes gene_type:complete
MKLRKLEDHDLVAQYRDGNEQAFEVLIRRHQKRIFLQIYSKVQDTEVADDLFQETFIKVIRSLRKSNYEEKGKFLPWAIRVANNTTLDFFRREARKKEFRPNGEFTVFDTYGESDQPFEQELIESQINEDLHKLITYLPDEQRQVLELRIFCNYSFKEIAEETDVSINTALGRMRYAVGNIQKLMLKHNISLEF